ncbi:NAD(P)-dependent oxidoreductase [Pseudonocardia kujensis]|uniref:NAD(P)-dependent oxidoreductase n=1 Tax=Pseudonocardia kujensis TaxID=1128675 RepID=UPI001E457D66|nr:NAD(P)-dependent oxidoreductase [Pseudonocardia kujensis]MCE0763426.1 NAD(P)-dependent oxidoreductase [Pseudonocardia kujensis]
MNARLGFLGLGGMGRPMALRLLGAGHELVVWNRTAARAAPVVAAGARLAATPAELLAAAEVVVVMLADEAAVDTVLARDTPAFAGLVRGRTVVHTGTVSAGWSKGLEADVRAAGGRYVEAPVSGSRTPAEEGALVGMLAGDPDDVARVRPLLAPLCARIVDCGPVPSALRMKFAVNTVLITLVAGLAEAWRLATAHGLDPQLFTEVLDAGPMASPVSRSKLGKLRTGDLTAQAAIDDVLKNCRLVRESAREVGSPAPLMEACLQLFTRAADLGLGKEDMVAVLHALDEGAEGVGAR